MVKRNNSKFPLRYRAMGWQPGDALLFPGHCRKRRRRRKAGRQQDVCLTCLLSSGGQDGGVQRAVCAHTRTESARTLSKSCCLTPDWVNFRLLSIQIECHQDDCSAKPPVGLRHLGRVGEVQAGGNSPREIGLWSFLGVQRGRAPLLCSWAPKNVLSGS